MTELESEESDADTINMTKLESQFRETYKRNQAIILFFVQIKKTCKATL